MTTNTCFNIEMQPVLQIAILDACIVANVNGKFARLCDELTANEEERDDE